MGVARIVRGLGALALSRTGKRLGSLIGCIVVLFLLVQHAFPDVTAKVTIPVPYISVHYANEKPQEPVHKTWTEFLSEDSDDSESDSYASSKAPHSAFTSDYHQKHHHNKAYYNSARFNESKVALLIENRPMPLLAPLLLHFISVVPPDWRFRFMGSRESVDWVQQSFAIRQQVSLGKLDLTYIPSNMTTAGSEEISTFLTNRWVYETLLQPAEWLLVFQTDSMLCANSRQNIDDYLEYDWVGSPWNPNGDFGGNGGLSMRRVSSIVQILTDQERIPHTEPEDVWLTDRLGHRPGAKMANGTTSMMFSGEMNPGSKFEMLYEDELKAAAAAKGKPPPNADGSELDHFAVTKDNIHIDEAGTGGIGGDPNDKGHGKKKGKLDMTNGIWREGIDDYRIGHYEPMGYHIGSSGANLHGGIWGSPELRKHIWDYCPEVKLMLQMDAASYVPGECNGRWKRDGSDFGDAGMYGAMQMTDLGYGTEWIDGVEYPMFPPGFRPW